MISRITLFPSDSCSSEKILCRLSDTGNASYTGNPILFFFYRLSDISHSVYLLK